MTEPLRLTRLGAGLLAVLLAALPGAPAHGRPQASALARARLLAAEGLRLLESDQPALAEAELEEAGCGAAFLDYDDGRLDVFLRNGATLEGFPKGGAERSPLSQQGAAGPSRT